MSGSDWRAQMSHNVPTKTQLGSMSGSDHSGHLSHFGTCWAQCPVWVLPAFRPNVPVGLNVPRTFVPLFDTLGSMYPLDSMSGF